MSISFTLPEIKWDTTLQKKIDKNLSLVLTNKSNSDTDHYSLHRLSEHLKQLNRQKFSLIRAMAEPMDLLYPSMLVEYPISFFELFNSVSPKLIVKKDRKLTLRPLVQTEIQLLSYLPLRYNEMIWSFEKLKTFLEKDKLTITSFSTFPLHILQAFYLYRLKYSKDREKKLKDEYFGYELDETEKKRGYFFDKDIFLLELQEKSLYTVSLSIEEKYQDIRNPTVLQELFKKTPQSDLVICEYGLDNPEKKCSGKWSIHLKRYYLNSLALSTTLLTLKTQKKGGNAILKFYHFNPVLFKLLAILRMFYREVSLFHPQYSRVTEQWVLCFDYQGGAEKMIASLEKLHKKWYQPGRQNKTLAHSICLPVENIFPEWKLSSEFDEAIHKYIEKYVRESASKLIKARKVFGSIYFRHQKDTDLMNYLLLSTFHSHLRKNEFYLKKNHLPKSILYNRELTDILSYYIRQVLFKKLNKKVFFSVKKELENNKIYLH